MNAQAFDGQDSLFILFCTVLTFGSGLLWFTESGESSVSRFTQRQLISSVSSIGYSMNRRSLLSLFYSLSHTFGLLLVAHVRMDTKGPADVSAVYVGSVSQYVLRREYVDETS